MTSTFTPGADTVVIGTGTNQIKVVGTAPATTTRTITIADPGVDSKFILRDDTSGSQTINGTVVCDSISGSGTKNMTISLVPGSGWQLNVLADYMDFKTTELTGFIALEATNGSGEIDLQANNGFVFVGGTNTELQFGGPRHVVTNYSSSVGRVFYFPSGYITTTDATPTNAFTTAFTLVAGRVSVYQVNVLLVDGSTDSVGWLSMKTIAKNIGGVYTITNFNTVNQLDAALSTATIAMYNSITNGMNLHLTGIAGKTINWHVEVIEYNMAGA